ncbi:MAG: methionine--tRNA ligase [Candidatus Omnitrophica bacterium]|nr:methionine--tRNA ligase [Candidatus Omnitrophota bacterium]
MSKPYYITTPLYYVNDKPHIGHAYTNILCDTFARFHRFMGENVFFLTGTDEHGEKIDKTARAKGVDTQTFVDSMVPRFKELWAKLGIQYDFYIRTTDEDHKKSVQVILQKLFEKGDIYLGKYKGWYCTPCESFWTKMQLVEGKCPDCKRDVQEIFEDNYFFKLSKYQDWLIEYIEKNPDFIFPESRRNEILGFLKQPLEDLCISRPRTRLAWGIDIPFSKDHVVYVWFDALSNYISAIGYPGNMEEFELLWPANLHMVGKDILRQHTVYWPIMLKALDLEMPGTVFAHGWWTMEGAKVSKSVGNVVDPLELSAKYGVDTFRYFLLREVTLGSDGAYSEDLLIERFNKDLANDLGNLVLRTTSMLERYFGGKIKCVNSGPSKLKDQAFISRDAMIQAMKHFDPRAAISAIWDLIVAANRYVEETKPWALAKEKKIEELGKVLSDLLESVRFSGMMLAPFLPETSVKICGLFGSHPTPTVKDLDVWGVLKPGMTVQKGEALFPRIEEPKS